MQCDTEHHQRMPCRHQTPFLQHLLQEGTPFHHQPTPSGKTTQVLTLRGIRLLRLSNRIRKEWRQTRSPHHRLTDVCRRRLTDTCRPRLTNTCRRRRMLGMQRLKRP